MEVKLAKSAGFCWGVKRAIDKALELRSQTEAPIHTLGPLIHNPQTLAMLQSKRVEEAASIEGVLATGTHEGYMVIRAHGIPPETRQKLKESSLKIVDATCPDVGLIQGLIRKHVRKGFDIVILGDPKHAEVIGLSGYSEGRGHVIERVEDVALLPALDQVFVVAQSTLDGETWLKITDALQARFPNTSLYNTICDATTDRQSEVLKLCQEVDAMVVVGGRASANTMRLAKLSQDAGVETFQVETDEEIEDQWFRRARTVGVTAGASTPNWLIMKVVKRVETIEASANRSLSRFFHDALEFILHHHILLAIGAAALSYVTNMMMGLVTGKERFLTMAIVGLFVYSMHNFHGSRELGTFGFKDLVNWKFYRERGLSIFMRSGGAFFISLFFAAVLSWRMFVFYLTVSVLGFAYRLEFLPEHRLKFLKYRTLQAIPGSRDIFIAMAWATMIVGLPALCLAEAQHLTFIQELRAVNLSHVTAFAFVAAMVFVRALVSDERDIKRDKLIGRETLPIVLGEKQTFFLQVAVLLAVAALLLVLGFRGKGNSLSLALLPALAVTYLYVHLYHFRVKYRSLVLDLMADAKFLAIGIWTFTWWHWIS